MKIDRNYSLAFDILIPLAISISMFLLCYYLAFKLMLQVNGPVVVAGLNFSGNDGDFTIYFVTNLIIAAYFYGILNTFYRGGLVKATIAFIIIPFTSIYGFFMFLRELIKRLTYFLTYIRNKNELDIN